MKAMNRLFSALASYTLTTCVLLYLMVLTLVGTLEQAEHGLFAVQERWFASLVVIGESIPWVLPGGALALGLLFVNLVVGGIVRLGRRWDRAGILTVHLGIALLLLGGLWEASQASKGQVTLYPGQSAREFSSYDEWEVRIAERLERGRERVWVIPHAHFARPGLHRFVAENLPFELRLSEFLPHCRPVREASGIEGVSLQDRPAPPEVSHRRAGLLAEAVADEKTRGRSLLWAGEAAPWVLEVEGASYEIGLGRRTWPLPFEIELVEFRRELHPGTGMASRFSSDVRRREGREEMDVPITMNEPMRHAGYTFYQSGWGPENAPEGTPLFSTFSVVRNPADRIPLYACIIISFGLVWHFQGRLRRYVGREARRRP